MMVISSYFCDYELCFFKYLCTLNICLLMHYPENKFLEFMPLVWASMENMLPDGLPDQKLIYETNKPQVNFLRYYYISTQKCNLVCIFTWPSFMSISCHQVKVYSICFSYEQHPNLGLSLQSAYLVRRDTAHLKG